MNAFVGILFALTYLVMAIGQFPGLVLDRAGTALLATILLLLSGVMTPDQLVQAVNFPTLFVLFGLMILSAQYAVSGFYDWCALRIARAARQPMVLLAVTVVVGGALSALLANDVVVFAITPLLCLGLKARGADPRPYLAALCGAANAGSAATIIGNPQNIVIGQLGKVGFWRFLEVCGVPAVVGLVCVFVSVALVWRTALRAELTDRAPDRTVQLDRRHLAKALAGTVLLLVLFASPLPREVAVLAAGGAMMISRRVASRGLIERVDWPLLVLFACLFVLNAALAATGGPPQAMAWLAQHGLLPDRLLVMTPFALLTSTTIGNVPAVVLLLSVWHHVPEGAVYGLALMATLAGNLLLTASLANIIVVERAGAVGVKLGFLDHARAGVPMTVASILFAGVWLWAFGLMPL